MFIQCLLTCLLYILYKSFQPFNGNKNKRCDSKVTPIIEFVRKYYLYSWKQDAPMIGARFGPLNQDKIPSNSTTVSLISNVSMSSAIS